MSFSPSLFRRLLVAITLFGGAVSASANTYNFSPSDGDGDPDDLWDLDHYTYVTWGIKNFTIPTGQVILSATLTINDVNNWDASENNGTNWLNIWLMDRALQEANYNSSSSVADGKAVSYTDAAGGMDIFTTWQPTINKTKIATYTDHDGGTHGDVVDLTYIFSPALLTALTTYINNGNNFALGFDPDCHYWNTGVQFQITTGAPPSPPHVVPDGGATAALLGLACGLMAFGRRRFRR